MLNGSKQIVEENWSKSYFLRDWLQKVAFYGNIVCTAPDEKKVKKKTPGSQKRGPE